MYLVINRVITRFGVWPGHCQTNVKRHSILEAPSVKNFLSSFCLTPFMVPNASALVVPLTGYFKAICRIKPLSVPQQVEAWMDLVTMHSFSQGG